MREVMVSPEEQVLARATKAAIQCAGGLEICASETGLSTSQLSRCSSPFTRDSISIRDALAVDAIGHGHAGHPQILRTMARLLGFAVIAAPEMGDGEDGLMMGVARLATELGDVSAAIVSALADDAAVSPAEAQAALQQMDELDAASASLRRRLMALAYPPRDAG